MKTQSKQITRILSASVKITNIAVLSSNSSKDVSSVIATALTTAGDNNTAVPLQVSTSSAVPGIIVASGINRIEIFDFTSKDKISTTSNYEVYGRLTNSSSVYTISFFFLDNTGTEQPYTFTSNQTIDFDFNYRYEFHQLPTDALVFQATRNVASDPKTSGAIPIAEVISVLSINTLSALSTTPNLSKPVFLNINGKQEDRLGGSPAFTVLGVNVTWNQTNGGYPLETNDRVVAVYYI